MKKLFALPVLPLAIGLFILLSVGSCKKSEEGGSTPIPADQYYLRFKANGVQKEFTGVVYSDYNLSKGIFYYALTGVTGLADLKGVVIAISTDVLLEKRTYTEQVFPKTSVSQTIIGYKDDAGVQFVSQDPRISTDANAKVTITEITATSVKGTFGAKVHTTDLKSSQLLTDGEFLMQRKK